MYSRWQKSSVSATACNILGLLFIAGKVLRPEISIHGSWVACGVAERSSNGWVNANFLDFWFIFALLKRRLFFIQNTSDSSKFNNERKDYHI